MTDARHQLCNKKVSCGKLQSTIRDNICNPAVQHNRHCLRKGCATLLLCPSAVPQLVLKLVPKLYRHI